MSSFQNPAFVTQKYQSCMINQSKGLSNSKTGLLLYISKWDLKATVNGKMFSEW